MTVSDLIAFLQTQPQDLMVAYELYSEQCLIEVNEIVIMEASVPRHDGWIEHKRSDKPTQKYLLFPGH